MHHLDHLQKFPATLQENYRSTQRTRKSALKEKFDGACAQQIDKRVLLEWDSETHQSRTIHRFDSNNAKQSTLTSEHLVGHMRG